MTFASILGSSKKPSGKTSDIFLLCGGSDFVLEGSFPSSKKSEETIKQEGKIKKTFEFKECND